ncbi:hypothetical protein B8V81_3487 [Paenibacillus pasadenensis]|uniref:Uncharacterized protein n=1 Tax=Paenibacillus pasadenensis TaxID=217090 RepID=A0A2N5N3Y2_9BACL|nr:hypothetical protein B8V81_3487 [Paenibacillus pasadenensis]
MRSDALRRRKTGPEQHGCCGQGRYSRPCFAMNENKVLPFFLSDAVFLSASRSKI